jgi:hypothetical protein
MTQVDALDALDAVLAGDIVYTKCTHVMMSEADAAGRVLAS